MATSVTWNNTSYSIPAAGEINWSSLSNFLIALGGGAGQPGAQVAGKAQKVGMRVVTAAGTVTVSDVDDCVVEINKTSGAATLVALPAGVAGRIFMIVDGKGDAASNNITISPNPPETIMGASSFVMNVNKSAVIIGYDGSDWKIIANYEGASIPDSRLATISTAGKVANSATTAASANTASAIVARDASGNFSAGTITATLSGNATTATTATTAANISGSNFTNDIANVGNSMTVSYVGGKTSSAIATSVNDTVAATNLNTASTIVKRDASGNFSAGTITANLSGNATTATSTTNFSGSLSGDVTGTQSSTAISDSTVTGKALTGFVSGAGTVSATDTILQAFNKIDGNVAGKEPTITTLAASKGGLATDASAFTGVVKASSGTFSAATIVNADVSASAAIDHSKLANITAGSVLLGNASNVPTATALTGDVTVNSTGVTAISSGVIVNADVNASAAIAGTKISPDFGSQNVATTGSVSGTNVVNAGYEEFSQIATPSNPASNKVRVYAKSDSKMYLKDSSGNETAIGSGSGSSGVNYLSDWYNATKQVTSQPTGITNGTSNIVTTAGSFVVGATYTILTVGTTDFTAIGASSNTVGVTFIATGVGSGTGTARHAGWVTANVDVRWANSGSYVVGTYYYIRTVGTTDFTLIGAASNTVGLLFRATGVGAGTGTAFNAVVYSQTSSSLRGTTNYAISTYNNDGTGNSAFIQTPAFQLDAVDLRKAISISFDCAGAAQVNGTQGYDVIAVRYNSSGVFQELIPIAGTASTATVPSALLPLGTATFNGFFISGSTASDYYAIRWRSLGSNSNTLIFDSVTVGPQQVLQGAIVTDWTEEAITWNQDPGLNTSGSYIAPKIKWRRVGSNMEGFYDFRNGGLSASNSVQVSIKLPSNLTIDSTKYTALPAGVAGVGFARKAGVASEQLYYFPTGPGTPSKSIYIYLSNTTIAANDGHGGWFSIPILEWQSNTQQAARAVEEYASYNGTTTVYGPLGSPFPAPTLGTGITLTNSWQTPYLPTDSIFVETDRGTSGAYWYPAWLDFPYISASAKQYGLGSSTPTATSYGVYFGDGGPRPGSNAFGSNGSQSWGSIGWRYRVRKVSGGAAVGYPVGARNVIGDTTGTVVPAGYIGEHIESVAASDVNMGSSAQNITSITLTTGVWNVHGIVNINKGTATLNSTNWEAYITLNSASSSGTTYGQSFTNVAIPSVNNSTAVLPIYRRIVVSAATQVVYLAANAPASSGNAVGRGSIMATRIA